VRVYLLAEDPLVLAGLGALLSTETDISVVGQGPPDSEGQERLATTSPDVVVWDMGAGPDDSVPDGAPVGVPLLALVANVEQATAALAAGARGAIFRDSGSARLAAALRAVVEGLFVGEEALALSAQRRDRAVVELVEPLTRREREVLDLLVQGLTNRLIGERLGISEHTAKFHVNAILGKLGVQSRTEAVAEAARLGLVVF
jgi:two-component system, NarL family, nitrate/nitrite response regulator NarL